jgi:hypothetical protein
MPARLTAYVPDQPALSHLLADGGTLRIGRGEDCGLRLDHPSISRSHAELRPDGAQGWLLCDLGSKNGSHLDGAPIREARLTRAGWLRLGDLYCEFEPLDPQAGAMAQVRLQARRARATALTVGLRHASGFSTLLDGSLGAVMELAHCDRGFLLLQAGDGGYAVRAQRPAVAGGPVDAVFAGSRSAVERTLREGRPVVVNEIGDDAWLASRASVVAGGLRALVCMPLRDGDESLGAIYADRRGAGAAITALDLELLEAFTERAALYIATRRASDALAMDAAPRWPAAPPAGVATP